MYVILLVSDGEKLEMEVNQKGPGEAFFRSVDLTDEEAIKVSISVLDYSVCFYILMRVTHF